MNAAAGVLPWPLFVAKPAPKAIFLWNAKFRIFGKSVNPSVPFAYLLEWGIPFRASFPGFPSNSLEFDQITISLFPQPLENVRRTLAMASAKTLATQTRKELAQMAKYNKVEGWHSMKKAELIDALKNRRLKKGPSKTKYTERSRALRLEDGDSRVELRRSKSKSDDGDPRKPPAGRPPRLEANAGLGESERLLAAAQGPHWIAASWRLTAGILDRAEASLGKDWHLARPVLRVFDVNPRENASPSKCCVQSIALHGGVDHWFVPIADPKRVYELQIGYETAKGRFFALARSTAVRLPAPGSAQARKYDEQRIELAQRQAESNHRFPIRGAAGFRFSEGVTLEIDADLLIVGKTSPHAKLNCQEEKVPVDRDGAFEVRLALEEGRHVIPLEAFSPDGCQSRTLILAIERNTKTLEAQALNDWD